MFLYEPRTERWIQVEKEQVEKCKDKGVFNSYAGYEFKDEAGKEWFEFHVDAFKTFAKIVRENPAEYKHGGKRSQLFINAPTTIVTGWEMAGLFAGGEIGLSKVGYNYDLNGVSMTEVHALHFKDDDATRDQLHTSMKEYCLFFGVSVRQPLIIFGQDEAIFKQYLLTLKLWLGRGGKQPLRPKDEGMGMMASVFKSRPFGFV